MSWSVIGSTRSTRSSVASPRTDWISCTSHWKSSVVSGVSGRIQPALLRRTAPIRCNFRHTPTRCRVGVGGRLVRSVSQRTPVTVTRDTVPVKRYTQRNLPTLTEAVDNATEHLLGDNAIRDLLARYGAVAPKGWPSRLSPRYFGRPVNRN